MADLAAVRRAALPGRRRKPPPPAFVTLVLGDGSEVEVPPDSPLARAIGALAGLLAGW